MSCKARPVPLPLRVSPVSLPFRLSSPLRGRGLCRCGCVCVSGRGCASDDVSGSPCSTSRPDTSPSPAALSPTSRSTCGSPLSPCGLPLRLPALPCTGLPLLLGRSPLLMLLRQGRLRSLARRLDRGSSLVPLGVSPEGARLLFFLAPLPRDRSTTASLEGLHGASFDHRPKLLGAPKERCTGAGRLCC